MVKDLKFELLSLHCSSLNEPFLQDLLMFVEARLKSTYTRVHEHFQIYPTFFLTCSCKFQLLCALFTPSKRETIAVGDVSDIKTNNNMNVVGLWQVGKEAQTKYKLNQQLCR